MEIYLVGSLHKIFNSLHKLLEIWYIWLVAPYIHFNSLHKIFVNVLPIFLYWSGVSFIYLKVLISYASKFHTKGSPVCFIITIHFLFCLLFLVSQFNISMMIASWSFTTLRPETILYWCMPLECDIKQRSKMFVPLVISVIICSKKVLNKHNKSFMKIYW